MSGETNMSAHEKLIQEGGKALEDALRADMDRVDGGNSTMLESESSEPNEKENGQESEPDTEDATEETTDGDEGGQSKDSSSSEDKSTEGEQGKQEQKLADAKQSDQGKKKGKGKIPKLLTQRNSARDERDSARQETAAERQKREAAEKRIAELEKQIASIKQQGQEPKDEDLESEDDSTDEEGENVESLIDKKLDEREKIRERFKQKADADKQERDALISQYKPTDDELEAIEEVLKTHPTLSDEAALRIVSPGRFVENNEARKNARKLEAGSNARRDLRNDPSVDKMSTADLEKRIKEEVKAGRMTI